MIRKSIFFLLFCVFLSPVFSFGGDLADSSSPLHVIRTEFFDIIFPDECRESAQKIEAVCDDYYLEITKILETEAYQRFPVTITRSVESLNAYYAAVPYNRIVLFDTLPEESLDMYENTIQKVFYHELTHAVTYNMKSKLMKRLSFISDMVTPAWLSITTFWAEGATVSFESKGRGGRLNDPFATQMVNQSVIEGHFPSWRDVTGTRDTYPGGTDAYMFGSMFAAYLQETYGMSKYADFWKNAGSSLSLSFIAGVFKKTYGIKITEAWKNFEKTLNVPAAKKNAALLSKKKSRITALDSYSDGESGEVKIAYFDTPSSSLRLLTLDGEGKIKKNKKLLAVTGISRVSFSPDGKKLALSRTIVKKNEKCVLAEYDLTDGRYKEYDLTAHRDGYFRLRDDKMELASVRIEGGKAKGNAAVLLNDEELPFCPLSIENNLYASIIKDSLKWKIRLFDAENLLFEYDFSDLPGEGGSRKMILHNLHCVKSDSESIFLSFTWAELGMGGKMLSRAGFLKIDRKTMNATAFLQKENAFAGVLDAIAEKSAANLFDETSLKSDVAEGSFDLYLVAAEYEKTPLYRVKMQPDDFEVVKITAKAHTTARTALSSSGESSYSDSVQAFEKSHQELSYNPFRYYKRGIFVPFLGFVPSYSHDFDEDSSSIFGLTFVSTNPWGDRQISFSAGYDLSYKNGGFQLGFSGGDNSFAYSLSGSCLFDKEGFMQSVENIQLTKYLWRGKVSYFGAGTQGKFLYGRQICDENIEKIRDDSVGKSADGLAFVQFSNIHKISPGVYDYAGFAFQPFVLSSYRDSEKRFFPDKYVNAGAALQLRFPILIPFAFTANLFPSHKYAASGSVKAILADFEIHKGIPALSLFVQRFVLSAGYSGKLSYNHEELWDIKRTEEIFKNAKKSDYSDEVHFAGDLYFSPNTGFLANDEIQFSLGYKVIYRPNPSLKENKIEYGINMAFSN